jgi:hypothetical protein
LQGPALIKKGAAGRIYEINLNELDWNSVGGGERQMGYETHHQAVLEHPKLGTLTWSIWEYPDGVENFRETNVGKNKLVKDFEYGLEHEDPGPDDWSVYPIPENHLGYLLIHGSRRAIYSTPTRMIPTHIF